MRTSRQRGRARTVLHWAGWPVLAGGAVLCAVGWYGVSGERFAERQIPYLASCTVPGAALIVAGAVLLARGEQGLAAERVEELYRLLVASEDAGSADAAGEDTGSGNGPTAGGRVSGPAAGHGRPPGRGPGGPPAPGRGPAARSPAAQPSASVRETSGAGAVELVAVPGGTLLHRPDCPLVAGKPQTVPMTAGAAGQGTGMAPCPVCEPELAVREPGSPGTARESGAAPETGPEPESEPESKEESEREPGTDPGPAPGEPRRDTGSGPPPRPPGEA